VSKGSERIATLWEKKARMRAHEIKTLTSILSQRERKYEGNGDGV
jgi:hypothetical protein